jgi:CDP-diacylglycerol--glycerol-3-phosphate 3-phosphatidyltransferase
VKGRLSSEAWNLPNALTVLRIFLVPLLVVVLLTRTRISVLLGALIFGVAVLTDYLDGYLARRNNQVTRLGMLLDPLADKLLTTAAFLSLVERDAAPAWMVTIVIGRELAVTALRSIADQKGLSIPASPLGKGKMALQVVAIFLLLLAIEAPVLRTPGVVVLWLVVAAALVSGADYFLRFWRLLYPPVAVVTPPSRPLPEPHPPASDSPTTSPEVRVD